jgi:hypothetical protein
MPAESSHWAVAFERFMNGVEECGELVSGSVELAWLARAVSAEKGGTTNVDGGSVELACA